LSPRAAARTKPAPIDWLSILQFACAALAVAILLSVAGATLLSGFTLSASEGFAMLLVSFSMFFLATLLGPSVYYSMRRILGSASAPLRLDRRHGLLLLLLPLVFAAGLWATGQNYELLIVIFNLLTIGLSVAWVAWVAVRGIHVGSLQRAWGALASGLAATPFFALIIEGVALLIGGFLLGIYIQGNSTLAPVLEELQQIRDPELMAQNLGQLAADPLVFAAALFGLSVFVPIVEELLKPIGVYLLMGRKLTNAQGFAIGALCGAGYALAETALISANPEDLLVGNLARFGTTAMHIFTAALSGYGLARARNQRNWLIAPAFLLMSMVLHGVWNGVAVMMAAFTLQDPAAATELTLSVGVAAGVLGVLAFGSLAALYVINRRLVASQPS
jgi:hypothetical protein